MTPLEWVDHHIAHLESIVAVLNDVDADSCDARVARARRHALLQVRAVLVGEER